MSTAVIEASPTVERPARPTPAPIPFSRIVGVERRKMFDTRAGVWLMASIGILALLATIAVVAFSPADDITYEAFASAIGIPMSVILPVIAILSITGEYSQRTGLTTYTLVPSRGRTIAAKLVCSLGVGIVGMLVALGVGAVGNLVGSTIRGVDTDWDVTVGGFAKIVLAMLLTMMVGFMLGVLARSSAGAIVGYFVYSFVVPTIFGTLAAFQDWFANLQPWVDFNHASTQLYSSTMSAQNWAQIGITGAIWLVLPLLIGLRLVLRSEVK